MGYQACYECEMVYEVETDGSACPQCGRLLEAYDYQPQTDAAPAPEPVADPLPEPAATVALDVESMPPLPPLEGNAAGQRKSTLLGPPKPVPQPFSGDTLGGRDVPIDPLTGNTDPMPAPHFAQTPSNPPVMDELPRTVGLTPGEMGDLAPIGVVSASVPVPMGGDDLPRTMALGADQLDALPPMGEVPSMPSIPAGDRRTKAIDTGLLPLVDPGPPPNQGPAFGQDLSLDVPVIAERAALPTGNTERQMARLDTIQPRRRKGKGKSKVTLFVVLGLLLLGGVGAAVYFLVFAKDKQKTPVVADAPPPPPTWEERLQQQLDDGQAALPQVKGGARLTEGVFVAGGLEGFSTSLGSVTGMASTKIRPSHVKRDQNGAWMPALKSVLARHGSASATDVLSLAVDGATKAEHLVQMASSAHRAGFARCALVILRPGTDELSSLPFMCGSQIPEVGAVIYRVGKLSDHVTVKDKQNKVLSEGPPNISRTEDGKPDIEAIKQRLAALRKAHPEVGQVIVYPNELMKTKALAELTARIQTSPKASRYEKIAFALSISLE